MRRHKQYQEIHPEYQEDQSKLWDEKIVADLHTIFDSTWDTVRQFEVDRLFNLMSPERILDVGCGCGYHDLLMAQKDGVKSVEGIDYSPSSIEKANVTYLHPNVSRYTEDVMQKEPADFDLAISFQVIEHLKDPVAFLSACAQQVKPGGWIAVLTPNRKRLHNRLRALFGLPPALEDSWHYREYTIGELAEMDSTIGLKHEASFGYMMTLSVPKLGWPLIHWRVGLKLGYLFPSIANRFCIIMKREV